MAGGWLVKQANLQDICEEIVDSVEGALGFALVDLNTGLPLALDVKPSSLLNSEAMELLSLAGATYFKNAAARGRTTPTLRQGRGGRAGPYLQDIQATTEVTYNFMSLVPGGGDQLMILVTDRSATNLGLGWLSVRRALDLVLDVQEDGMGERAAPQPVTVGPIRFSQPTSDFINPPSRGRRTIWGQR